jgi:hypothetical protein
MPSPSVSQNQSLVYLTLRGVTETTTLARGNDLDLGKNTMHVFLISFLNFLYHGRDEESMHDHEYHDITTLKSNFRF